METRFKLNHPDARLPTYGNDDELNAGLDFYSPYEHIIHPHESAIIDLGVAWDASNLVSDYEKPVLIIKSRSGLAFNFGIEASGAGVIDTSFTKNIKVKLYNNSTAPYMIHRGDRICQGLIIMMPILHPVEIETIEEIERDGFGSTGR